MVEIAVMGHGVVGSGVVEVIEGHFESIAKRAGDNIRVKYILDLRDFPNLPYSDRFTKDFSVLLNDPEVRVVVEAIGGLTPAYDFVKKCLLAGKSVVTSNKEMVAEKGAELLQIARDNNVNFLFEASVGGGIPIIRPISQCLAANMVTEITGILNGTTNYILTKMIKEQVSFNDALKTAQELGYAERDPSADIEGDDACRKICILASLAFGKHVYPEQVHTEGITKLTLQDVEYARKWGGVIKLIARTTILEDKSVTAIVAPMFVSSESQLSSVDDVFNAILVHGDSTGDVVFYGKGAGKYPTASAVVADVIDCAKHFAARKYLFWEDGNPKYVRDYLENNTSFFVRAIFPQGVDGEAQLKSIFGGWKVYNETAPDSEVGFITEKMEEKVFFEKISELENNEVKILNMIRVGDF